MSFEQWLAAAWDAHAADAAGVASRLEPEALRLAASDPELEALARLAHHVYGGHLGRIDAGRALLQRLAAQPAAGDATRAAVRLLDASLALTGGDEPSAELGRSDHIRVAAMAASNLAERDSVRAAALLQRARAEAEIAGLADGDPALRSLAAAGNNVAVALEEKPVRRDDERALMILAARTGREYWARAGTWLETERAEYRLAKTWLAAGDPVQARRHAQACLQIVREHGDVALEAFYGWEALGCVEAAAGDRAGHAQALAQARAAFERLDADDRGGCREALERLEAALAPDATPRARA
jgi:hypothetical protein